VLSAMPWNLKSADTYYFFDLEWTSLHTGFWSPEPQVRVRFPAGAFFRRSHSRFFWFQWPPGSSSAKTASHTQRTIF